MKRSQGGRLRPRIETSSLNCGSWSGKSPQERSDVDSVKVIFQKAHSLEELLDQVLAREGGRTPKRLEKAADTRKSHVCARDPDSGSGVDSRVACPG